MEPNKTMAPVQSPNQYHKDIPGNPSTATTSKIRLNDRSNGKPLRVMTEEDWKFWVHNGYVVIKNVTSGNLKKRTRTIRLRGTPRPGLKWK